MTALESLRIALQSLIGNPLRSLLTLVGIAVGIGAVLHVVSLGEMTQRRIRERLESMGTNVLLIRPGYSHMHGVRTAQNVTSLTWNDARLLVDESAVIARTAPTYSAPGSAEFRDRNWTTRVTGVTDAYFEINNETLATGRSFGAHEVDRRARLAVLGDTVRSELFGDDDPVGGEILVNSQRFTVIGALEARGESWSNPDDQIFVPLSTAQERLFGVDYLSSILAQMRAAEDFDEALFDIEELLRRSHRLRAEADNDFRVRRQDFFLATIQDTNREIASFILLIALVSLFVGGLGIANVMLVSVTERTREIGVRRALGANRSHVLLQFLIEAVVLGLLGGVLGVVGGTAVSRILIGSGATISWVWVGYSFGICAGIGLLAGMYPAGVAAYKNVLEALRYE
ncbi:MAG: ABC transporter permease [Deltaproteobacteria bacterium]|nr:ABC transporter permease [Deltaproteobacteria bacterium]